MDGTLSARPEGVVVSADESRWPVNRGCAAGAGRQQFGQYLERNRLALHVSAAMLASVPATAHLIEQVPVGVAPACAAFAAFIVILIAGIGHAPKDAPLTVSANSTEVKAGSAAVSRGMDAQGVEARSNPRAAGFNASLAAELQQAAALAQLTARISHDLRTPLNAVIGFSELMSKEAFGPLGSQRYQDYANHIRDCGQTLLKSTEDALAITSSLAEPMGENRAAGWQAIALGELVNEAWQCAGLSTAQERMSLHCDIPDTLELFGERRVMRQILINLIQDAISRGCGHSQITVGAVLSGGGIRLTVGTSAKTNRVADDSLPLCVARALLELHGLQMAVSAHADGLWQVSVELDRATQRDFFAEPRVCRRAQLAA